MQSSLFVCLSGCLSVSNFAHRDTDKTCLGAGVHCPSSSSYF